MGKHVLTPSHNLFKLLTTFRCITRTRLLHTAHMKLDRVSRILGERGTPVFKPGYLRPRDPPVQGLIILERWLVMPVGFTNPPQMAASFLGGAGYLTGIWETVCMRGLLWRLSSCKRDWPSNLTMSIQRTFPELDSRFYKYHSHASNRDKDTQAMGWVQELFWSMGRCRQSGVTYAEGSWGYTGISNLWRSPLVLLTIHRSSSCRLHPRV